MEILPRKLLKIVAFSKLLDSFLINQYAFMNNEK